MTINTKPRVPTDYRLTSGAVRSSVAHVSVAPLVRFQGMPNAGKLRGYARPVFPGASVAIQRFDGGRWRAVARATVDAAGSFEATVNLSPGEYRARLAPGRGFVAGFGPLRGEVRRGQIDHLAFVAGVSPTLRVGPA